MTNKKITFLTLGSVLLFLLLVGNFNLISAQETMRSVGDLKTYLEIKGIEGNVADKGFEGAISIESWSMGITYKEETKANFFQDLYFVNVKNGASNGLFKAAVLNSVIPKAVLTVMLVPTDRNFPSVLLFRYTMNNVRVSSLNSGGSSGGNGIMDQVGLSFESGSYEGKGADAFNKKITDAKVDFIVPHTPKKSEKTKKP